MHCTTAIFPEEWEHAHIYILSDLHIGDPHANTDDIAPKIKRIQADPVGLCVLNGDIMNTATRNSVSDVYGELMTPMQQLTAAVELLASIKEKIIAADAGNHERRVYKTDGVDIMRLVCRELGREDRYAPEGVLVFLSFGNKSHYSRDGQRQTYSIYATHGTGGGRKEGAKAIRLADMSNVVDADIYIHSHTHLPMLMKSSFFRVDFQNRTARQIEKLFVNDGSSLDYGGYGQTNEFKPSSRSSPVITLNGRKREFFATI